MKIFKVMASTAMAVLASGRMAQAINLDLSSAGMLLDLSHWKSKLQL
jgi:hypothetical protein